MNDDGPSTRKEWLENNKSIMEQEQATEDEIFFNQIETRLANHMNWVDEGEEKDADERLGNAYINSLAQYEAEGEDATWCPLSVEHLVEHEGVTPREAGVIVIIAAREYPTKEFKMANNEKPEIDVEAEERLDEITRGILRNACDELGLEYNSKDDRLDKPLAFDLIRFEYYLDPMNDWDELAKKALEYTGE